MYFSVTKNTMGEEDLNPCMIRKELVMKQVCAVRV
jgi:hypothetical protein